MKLTSQTNLMLISKTTTHSNFLERMLKIVQYFTINSLEYTQIKLVSFTISPLMFFYRFHNTNIFLVFIILLFYLSKKYPLHWYLLVYQMFLSSTSILNILIYEYFRYKMYKLMSISMYKKMHYVKINTICTF